MHFFVKVLIFKYVTLLLVHALPVITPNQNDVQYSHMPQNINSLEEEHKQRALGDVAATINEVQKILETDPTLPRLTRGEIEELFENVTREEFDRSLRNGDHDRAKHMRALMLVLPYNTDNFSDARLQELYTRPPITKVIQNEFRRVTEPKNKIKVDSIELPLNTNRNHLALNPSYEKATTFHPKSVTVPTVPYSQPVLLHNATLIQQPSSIIVIESSTQKHEKLNSPVNADIPSSPNIPGRIPIRSNVKDLLATIGLTQEVLPTKKPELTPELRNLLQSFGLLTNEKPPDNLQLGVADHLDPNQEEFQPIISPVATESKRRSPSNSILKRSSYRMNTAPEISANDFQAFKPLPIPEDSPASSEMQQFLQSFGLFDGNKRGMKSMKDESKFVSTAKTPIIQPRRGIMNKMPEVNVDFLTPDLLSVLNNMGVANTHKSVNAQQNFVKAERRDFNVDDNDEDIKLPIANERYPKSTGHPFIVRKDDTNLLEKFQNLKETNSLSINGEYENVQNTTESRENNEVHNQSADELTKTNSQLQKLFAAIQNLNNFNGTENLTDSERTKLRMSILASFGPDPVNEAEIVNLLKKEIKRQSDEENKENKENNSEPIRFTLDLAATTEGNAKNNQNENVPFLAESLNLSERTSTVAPKTTPSVGPEIKSELTKNTFDSFASDLDPVTQIPLPAPRKNGFYFLADWNSFLEVGEDPDKVVVRFDPKIGDPSRFIPITVP